MPQRDTADAIRIFHAYFSGRLRRLIELRLDLPDRLYKKIVAVSLIDALSIAAGFANASPRERLTNVVAEHADWDDQARISATHLFMLLERVENKRFDGALRLALDRIHANLDGQLVLNE